MKFITTNDIDKSDQKKTEKASSNKDSQIDEIIDESSDNYENKNKAELILAQIQDKIRSK